MRLPFASSRQGRREAVMAAYSHIVARAREPRFFARWGVPDTLDGRFETLALHAFLALNRLKSEPQAKAFAQDLFDTMFADLDRTVREMGASDMGVGRYVKAMARGFYGRIAAYDVGLKGGNGALEDALRRNLYGTVAPSAAEVERAAHYVRAQQAALGAVPLAQLLSGEVPFAPLPDDSA